MDLLRVLSYETGGECANARAVIRLVREDWAPLSTQTDEGEEESSGAASRASSVLLLLRIITFMIHASGAVGGGMLRLLDTQAALDDGDPQTAGGSALRAIGAPVGNRECDYAADVVRLMALAAPACSSFREVEEALECVPPVSPRLVDLLRQVAVDLERARAIPPSGQVATLSDEELMAYGLVDMPQEEQEELAPGVVEM